MGLAGRLRILWGSAKPSTIFDGLVREYHPALTVGGAPDEDGCYRPDLLSGPSFATYGDTAKRVDCRKTAQLGYGNGF